MLKRNPIEPIYPGCILILQKSRQVQAHEPALYPLLQARRLSYELTCNGMIPTATLSNLDSQFDAPLAPNPSAIAAFEQDLFKSQNYLDVTL